MTQDEITIKSHEFNKALPKIAGSYRIGDSFLQVILTKKPNWFHRKMVLLCFGWEWIDG